MLVKRIITISLVAFALNFVWEMVQMPLFKGMSLGDLQAWLLCLRSTIGDVATVLSFCGLGRVVFRDWDWPGRLSIVKALYLLFVGLTFGIYYEITALSAGRWSYTELMPVLPGLEVGLVPLVQMMVLPYFSCKFGLKAFRKCTRGPASV